MVKKSIIICVLIILIFSGERLYPEGDRAIEWMQEPVNIRGAAMGRGFTALTDGANTVFWNPGGSASLKGVNISYTYYNWVNSEDVINALSFSTRKRNNVTLGFNYYRYDNIFGFTSCYFNTIGICLGYSFNNISIGINPKIFNFNYKNILTFEKNIFLALDYGILYSKDINIKSFSFIKNISLGASILNLSESIKFKENIKYYNSHTSAFPSLFRMGYSSTLNFLIKNKYLFSVINNFEYSDILNSVDIKYHRIIGGGLELSFVDFLFARLGYCHTLNYPYNGNAPEDGLTYGIGINVSLTNFIKKLPIVVKYDYGKFPRDQKNNDNWKIHSISMYLNY